MGKIVIMTDLKEIPTCCSVCPLCVEHGQMRAYCYDTNKIIFDEYDKPKWCRMIELPEKKDVKAAKTMTNLTWIEGWNACLESIDILSK